MGSADRFVRQRALAPEVWLALDERLGREVVLKRAAAGEPRAMARLNHPHVVAVYEHVEDWAVLEYAPGGSLAGQQLPAVEAARIGAEIADALAYMHGKGLVHCDVKPGNIVLTETGMAKLTDFGSAYHVDPDATITPVSQLSYTPAYAAPELVRGSPVPASDVYSLAATVRELSPELGDALGELLGANPHDRPNMAGARRLLLALAGGEHPPGQAGPVQLPAEGYGFAGRTAELDHLDRLAGPVVVVSGTAGVGKTTLAVHWAHRVAGRFPGGQLYVNLRGFEPTGQAMDAADAIRGFLDALGIVPERIPADLDAQGALYRSTLSAKRMLVLLDNARDADQVRPLLPGTVGCQVIVTSRNDLIGLITKEGARPLTLDVLTDTEARELLDHRLGAERTVAEPDAVRDIIESCARLPLALAIVAARAAIRPDFPLAALTNALASDDPETDVRTVFSWSYEQLSPEAQRLFRLLGLHPGPDISAPAAASLFGGLSPLAELTRAHLITEHQPGRYTFHDLLRAYAHDLAHTEERHDATHRLLDHYLHTAYTAAWLLSPTRDLITLAEPQPDVTSERPADHEQAMAWFSAEHSVLLAVLDHASRAGFETHAWQLAWAINGFLDQRGHWRDRVAAWQVALDATRRLGDRHAQARAHDLLAHAYLALGQADNAYAHLLRALELHRELGDPVHRAHGLMVLAELCSRQERHHDAIRHHRQALDLYLAVGHRIGQALALNGLGWDHSQLGQHHLALTYCEQSLTLAHELGDHLNEATALDSLGYAHHHLRQLEDATLCYQRALGLVREFGNLHYEAQILTHLGDTQEAIGDRDAARASWQRALTIVEELDRPAAQEVRAKLERDAPSA